MSHRRRGAAALVRQKHEEAAEAAAAAKIQGVCRGRIARRALSPRLAAAKQEQQQQPEPEPEPELVDVPVEEVRTADFSSLGCALAPTPRCAQVLRELAEQLPWGWEPVLSETQHAIYFVNNRGEW